MKIHVSPSASGFVSVVALAALWSAGGWAWADPVDPPLPDASPEVLDREDKHASRAEVELDPKLVKVGDRVKIVLRELNQRSGAIVFTATKAAYGTVRSVERLDVDGKENIVFELVPYGSDGKTVLKYDKETGQTFRVEPTVKFGTLQIAKMMEMPPDYDMRKIADFREVGDDGDAGLLGLGEAKEEVDRRIQVLRSEIKTLRTALADQEAAAKGAVKPAVTTLRDKGGSSRVDSASDTAAQDVLTARRSAAEAAVIRLKFRLSQKEDDLREEMRKAAEYGVNGMAGDDLASLSPGERRILMDSRVKTLGKEIRTLKEAIVNQEATSKSAAKPVVTTLRDKGGSSRVDSASDTAAQDIVTDRRNAAEAAIIRLKARLTDKEDELRVVREELAKMDR